MSIRSALSSGVLATALFAVTSPAVADPKEEALLPIERKISTFSIRLTKTGYTHFAAGATIPVGSVPAKILAINGRTSKDIWMLTDGGTVLQDDGKQIGFRLAKPCGWGEYNSEYTGVGTRLFNIVVDQDSVNVIGESRGYNTRIGQEIRASLAQNGKWTCTEKNLVPDLVHSSGAFSWRAAHNMDYDSCRIGSSAGHCTSGPRFSPTHYDPPRDSIDMGIHNTAMWMHGPDDGWIVTNDETFNRVLYRFNGVTWTRVLKFEEGLRIFSMWADDQRQVWFTAGGDGQWESPATMILRYDGKTLTQVPTPASFKTRWVKGHNSRDVWFGGGGDIIYQWDGSRLRQGKTPAEADHMWVSSDGVPFFVLTDTIAFAAPAGETR
jgi:hypothetical protein